MCAEGLSHTARGGADMGTGAQESSLAGDSKTSQKSVSFDLVILLLGICPKKII